MKRCLVINPNTTTSVTEGVVRACQGAFPSVQWQGVSVRFGAPYIADEIGYAVASHAVLDAHEAFFDGHDAVLVACFGDPGLLALRELAGVPVIGLAQASLIAAGRRGRFAIVTGGHAWAPMLMRFARAHELDDRLADIQTIDLTGAQIAANPDAALDALAAAASRGVDAGAECILLGGAALCGLAGRLQPRVGVPVLDNVLLAAQAVVDAPVAAPLSRARPVWMTSYRVGA
ncbi:MAG TPA: aspartate/glutamate racemase family protein [Rubrivivax sp.]